MRNDTEPDESDASPTARSRATDDSTVEGLRDVRTVDLGDVDPGGSRHTGRRSAVLVTADAVVVGTADGTVRAFERDGLNERWRVDPDGSDDETRTDAPGNAGRSTDPDTGTGSVVSLAVAVDAVVAGERGPSGSIRAYDRATGAERWRYDAASDVGDPVKETRFFLPFVVDIRSGQADGGGAVATDGRCYVAARRYERDGDARRFESVVYAFDGDGTVAWRYRADASPIALDARDDRVAVGYNRCPGDHQCGLVVLDAATGEPRMTWDPGTAGERRVGDVALLAEGLAVTSHGDYRGYRLDDGGRIEWRADLATPVDRDGETLYAYPNHVHATEAGVVFVTGNTYPEEGRQADARHPLEHAAVGYTPGGERRWTAPVGGFAGGLGTDGDRLAVPCAQNFRARDPETHAVRVFDVAEGPVAAHATAGVGTAAGLDGGTVAAVEEPVVYHDEGVERGAYRLHVGDLGRVDGR